MSRISSISEWLLRQALIWGGLACLAFYALVVNNAEQGTFLHRYFAGHPIAYCTTGLFFVGLAALVIKLLALMLQLATLDSVNLPSAGANGQTVDDVPALLAQLQSCSPALQESYLVRRLRDALEYVQRKSSADSIEQQLRNLEEADAARSHHSYSMVRIIVSVVPILGFLGTVVGITLAIAKLNLSADAVDESLPEVVKGLSVAFDTTALALSLSMILLFAKFCVERVESRLLEAVDNNVARQLIGRFQQYGSSNDPHLASVRQMSEELLNTVQTASERQCEQLTRLLEETSRHWTQLMTLAATTLDEALSSAVVDGMSRHAEALNEGVQHHAKDLEETLIKHAELLNEGLLQHTTALTEAEVTLAEENRRHLADVEAAVGEAMLVATNRQEKLISRSEEVLKEMQVAMVEAAGSAVAQQEQLIKQGDVLLRVIEATGQIKKLEDALNSNLKSLSGSHNFQQTVAGLSAALQLLGAHLGHPLVATTSVDLDDEQEQNQAA